MTLADHLGVPDRYGRGLARLLQAFMAGVVVLGAVRFDPGMMLTAGLPLAVTFVPAFLRRDYDVPMDWGWTLWISLAVGLHALGSLWAYHRYPWYDSVAHVVSGSLVAATGYALTMAFVRHADGVDLPKAYRGAYLLVVVLAFGVLWENLEHAAELFGALTGGKPPNVQYGATDTAKDLLADAVGGLLVAVWATPAIRAVPRALSSRWREGSEVTE